MFDGIESLKLRRICSVFILKVGHKKFRNTIYLGRGKTITFFKSTHPNPQQQKHEKKNLGSKGMGKVSICNGQQGYKEYDEHSMDQKFFQQLPSKSHKSLCFV